MDKLNNIEIKETIEDRILNGGYDNIIIFSDNKYDNAFIGISDDGRSIYDYDLMIEWLIEHDKYTIQEAIDWIDFNVLSCQDDKTPIVMYRV